MTLSRPNRVPWSDLVRSPALPLFHPSRPLLFLSSFLLFSLLCHLSSIYYSITDLSTDPSCLLSLHALTLPSQACRYRTTRPRPPLTRRSRRTQRSTGAHPPNRTTSGTSKILVSILIKPFPLNISDFIRGTKDRTHPPHRDPEDWVVRLTPFPTIPPPYIPD